MPRTDSFWALMRAGIAAGRRAWRPVNICVFRASPVYLNGARHRLIQEIGLLHNLGLTPKFRMTFRLTRTKAGDSISQALLRAVKAVFRGSVSIGHNDGTTYIHLALSSLNVIDASWRGIRLKLGRGILPGKRRANSQYEGDVGRAVRFIQRIMKEGTGVWSPNYASFRKMRHILFNGFRLVIQHEILWNEWDNQVSFSCQSASNITRDEWEGIKASGLVEALAADLGRIGYKVEMRAQLYGDGFVVIFSKAVNQKTITLEAHRLLKWRLPKSLPLQPVTHHSTRLFRPD